MAEDYLTTILEEAEHVAEQHDQVATADSQAREWLRYAVLRILEGQADHLPTNWTPIDGVTVGYDIDNAMFDSWGSSEDWWETVPLQETCTRFRVFFPDDHQTVPRDIVDVMTALGAWRVWTGSAAACGSYDHRERREVHYLWPEGHPVEEVLHERLSGPAEAVAPDGDRTGDVRDRLVVDENAQSKDDLEPPHEACRRRSDGRLAPFEGWPLRGAVRVRQQVRSRHHRRIVHLSRLAATFTRRRLQAPALRRSRDQTGPRSPTRRSTPNGPRVDHNPLRRDHSSGTG